MMGGYGKPLAVMMAAVMLPLYVSIFLMVIYPRHGLYLLAAGVGGVLLSFMMLETYKNNKYIGKRAIGLTRRMPGGDDDFKYIIFEKEYALPSENNGYNYAIRDTLTDEWHIFVLPHPWGELAFQEDVVPAGAFFIKMPTSYIEGAQLRKVKRPLLKLGFQKRLIDKLFKHEPPQELEVAEIYAYGTNKAAEKVFVGRPLNSKPPTKEQLEEAYRSYVLIDPDYSNLMASNEGQLKLLLAAEQTLLSLGKTAVKFSAPEVEEAGTGMRWLKWAAIIAAVGIGAFLLFRFLGWA